MSETSEPPTKIPWDSVRSGGDILHRTPEDSAPYHGARLLAGQTWPLDGQGLATSGAPLSGAFEGSEQTMPPAAPSLDPVLVLMDRAAVSNVLAAYALYVDESAYESWYDQCFWPDATLKMLLPDGNGNVGFQTDTALETIKPRIKQRHDTFKAYAMQRRRIMGGTLFLEQSRESIHVLQQALLVNVNSQKPPVEVIMPIVYEGWFEKRAGVWKILRWIDRCDTVGDGGTEPKRLNPLVAK